MSEAPRMVFNGVWATMLVSRVLPGHEKANEELLAFIAEQEASHRDNTARYQEQRFFSIANSAMGWLREQIDGTARAFLRQSGIERPLSWTLAGWYNINRLGDHHAPHTHPWSYLSGTYYVRVPEGDGKPDSRSGCITFHDPRTAANMVTLGQEPDARASHSVRPRAGTLLMWPSPLQHSVHPNLSEEHRVSISFNLMMERSSVMAPGGI